MVAKDVVVQEQDADEKYVAEMQTGLIYRDERVRRRAGAVGDAESRLQRKLEQDASRDARLTWTHEINLIWAHQAFYSILIIRFTFFLLYYINKPLSLVLFFPPPTTDSHPENEDNA